MIKRSDVIRIKMPFPHVKSNLAVNSHMYICHCVNGHVTKFVKCQTLKPYMLASTPIQHYWDETPDSNRNPFQRLTRIDCDKEFVTQHVKFDDNLKTTIRPDVCPDVMSHIDYELQCDGYSSHHISDTDLVSLNPLITKI